MGNSIGDNFLYSDDLEKRREELQGERDAIVDKMEDFNFLVINSEDTDGKAAEGLRETEAELEDWDSDNGEELRMLTDICSQGRDFVDDWTYGVALYHEDIFDDHAEEVAKDCSDVPRNQWDQWPFNCIDWSEAAELLKQDYTTIEIEGHTYYVR